MTTPAPETLEREKDKLYLTEAELIRRMGIPYRTARAAIRELQAKASFPRKQRVFGDRYYWPAVKDWLDNYGGLSAVSPQDMRKRA